MMHASFGHAIFQGVAMTRTEASSFGWGADVPPVSTVGRCRGSATAVADSNSEVMRSSRSEFAIGNRPAEKGLRVVRVAGASRGRVKPGLSF